jgi:hypothetical protein
MAFSQKQPTHGPAIYLKNFCEDSLAFHVGQSYLSALTILLVLKLKHKLWVKEESDATIFCKIKTKLLTRIDNSIGINNLLTQS